MLRGQGLWNFCTATYETLAHLWAPPSWVFCHLTKGGAGAPPGSGHSPKEPQHGCLSCRFPCQTPSQTISNHQKLQNLLHFINNPWKIAESALMAAAFGGRCGGRTAHQAGWQGGRLGHLAACRRDGSMTFYHLFFMSHFDGSRILTNIGWNRLNPWTIYQHSSRLHKTTTTNIIIIC